MTPAAVLWDLDGTLIDGEAWWHRAHRDLAASFGGHLPDDAATALAGCGLDDGIAAVLDACGLPPTDRPLAVARRRLIASLTPAYAGCDAWLPGAREAVHLVRAAGIRTGLVTNTPRDLVEPLLRSGSPFTTVVCADDVPRGKPDPAPYLLAADLLGVPVDRCVAVEDSPAGVTAATRAGVARVLVVPGALPVPPGPGLAFRDGLVGLTVEELSGLPLPARL